MSTGNPEKPIAVVGTGQVARSLAVALVKLGKKVIFATRDPHSERNRTLLLDKELYGSTVAKTHSDACKAADIIVLATPGGQATIDVFSTLYKAALLSEDKIVVDLTNPFSLDHKKSDSGGEMLQKIAASVRVVKTLNSVGHDLYTHPKVNNVAIDMFVAADDLDAKRRIMHLVGEMGFNPVNAGGIESSRWMEALGYGWVHMAHTVGYGRNIGWKLLVPEVNPDPPAPVEEIGGGKNEKEAKKDKKKKKKKTKKTSQSKGKKGK